MSEKKEKLTYSRAKGTTTILCLVLQPKKIRNL